MRPAASSFTGADDDQSPEISAVVHQAVKYSLWKQARAIELGRGESRERTLTPCLAVRARVTVVGVRPP